MKFEISLEKLSEIAKWLEEINTKALEKQKENLTEEEYDYLTLNGKFLYTGAIGGNITYSFTPTSLGMVIKIKEAITEEELDITDYDSW